MSNKIKRNILIYGATGMVGQAVVKHLLQKNYNITVLARNMQKAKKLFDNSVCILSDSDDFQTIFKDKPVSFEAVINLAGSGIGEKRWTKNYKNQIVQSRVQSVKLLQDIVSKMKVKPTVWIQASAIGYYGANTTKITDESGGKGEGFLANVVSEWESVLKNYDYLSDVRKVFLRIGIVMSKRDGFLKQMISFSNLGVVALPFKRGQVVSWIHLNDLVKLIENSLCNENYTGVVNAVSPESIPMKDLKHLLLKNSRAFFILNIPAFFFRILLGSKKTDEMILANQNIIPSVLTANNFKYSFKNLDQVFENNEQDFNYKK